MLPRKDDVFFGDSGWHPKKSERLVGSQNITRIHTSEQGKLYPSAKTKLANLKDTQVCCVAKPGHSHKDRIL